MMQVVHPLLDIRRTPRKPQYTKAPELPLILLLYPFDKISYVCSSGMHFPMSILTSDFISSYLGLLDLYGTTSS